MVITPGINAQLNEGYDDHTSDDGLLAGIYSSNRSWCLYVPSKKVCRLDSHLFCCVYHSGSLLTGYHYNNPAVS